MSSTDAPLDTPRHEDGGSDDASMRLNVNFVPPLVDNQDEAPLAPSTSPRDEHFFSGPAGFDPLLHGFFSQFTQDDNQWMSSIPEDGLINEAPLFATN